MSDNSLVGSSEEASLFDEWALEYIELSGGKMVTLYTFNVDDTNIDPLTQEPIRVNKRDKNRWDFSKTYEFRVLLGAPETSDNIAEEGMTSSIDLEVLAARASFKSIPAPKAGDIIKMADLYTNRQLYYDVISCRSDARHSGMQFSEYRIGLKWNQEYEPDRRL